MKSLRVLGMTQNLPSVRVLLFHYRLTSGIRRVVRLAQHLTPILHPRGMVGTDMGKSNGAVEVGITCVGGMECSKREWKKQNAGRGQVGKSAMVGIRDCETNRLAASPRFCNDSRTNGRNLIHWHPRSMREHTTACIVRMNVPSVSWAAWPYYRNVADLPIRKATYVPGRACNLVV